MWIRLIRIRLTMIQTLFTDTVKLYCVIHRYREMYCVILTDTVKLYCVINSFTFCAATKLLLYIRSLTAPLLNFTLLIFLLWSLKYPLCAKYRQDKPERSYISRSISLILDRIIVKYPDDPNLGRISLKAPIWAGILLIVNPKPLI